MDIKKLKALIDMVSESNVSELEITEAEGSVRIVKTSPAAAPQMMQMPAMMPMQTQMQAAPMMMTAPAAAPAEAAPEAAGHTVKSPMVGTFYSAPSPGASPFVEIGAQVKVGDVLCIIEAMKILNEIEADRAGTVTRVMGVNGEAVEYGQPLFIIE